MLTPRTAVPEGSLIGIPGRFAVLSVSFQLVKRVKCSISTSAHKNLLRINDWFPVSGSNQGSNNLTLKGWPLTVSFIHVFLLGKWNLFGPIVSIFFIGSFLAWN